MDQSVAPTDATPELSPLEERLLAIVMRRGYAGITRDELLRKLGASYDDLMAALEGLHVNGQVRVHWPTPDTFRVFYTG